MASKTFVRGDTWTFDFQVGNRSALAVDQGVATAVGTNTLTDSAQAWTPSALAGRLLSIESGPGAGGLYQILDNTATVLTIERGWDGRPSTTSVYNILAAIDIGAWQASVTVKTNAGDTDANALIGPVWATLASDANTALGKGTATLTATATNAATAGKLHYDVQIADPGQSPPQVITVQLGTVTVKTDVSVANAAP